MLRCLLLLTLACTGAWSYDREMTVTIDAGKRECFYHFVDSGEIIDIEYQVKTVHLRSDNIPNQFSVFQVIDGGHGDLDINFDLSDPNKRILYADFKKPDNLHRHEVKLPGDYAFCFDNTISHLNKKTVFFELIIEREGEENRKDENDLYEGLRPEEVYDLQVQDIQDSIHTVRAHLTKARQVQEVLRSHEARDRNLVEENYYKVNVWSAFQVLAMMLVGAVQVIMLRSLFDANSKVNKLWSKFAAFSR